MTKPNKDGQINDIVRWTRSRLDETQKTFAQRFRVHVLTVSAWETGHESPRPAKEVEIRAFYAGLKKLEDRAMAGLQKKMEAKLIKMQGHRERNPVPKPVLPDILPDDQETSNQSKPLTFREI